MEKVYVVYNQFGAYEDIGEVSIVGVYTSKEEAEKIALEREAHDKLQIVDSDYGIDYSHFYCEETNLI